MSQFHISLKTKLKGRNQFNWSRSSNVVRHILNFKFLFNQQKRLIDDINRGIIKPLNTTVFDACDIVKAARYLARAKHVGKVLLKIRESELSRASLPIDVKPRIFFNPNHSYIVPGGLGGMGLGIVDWMVLRECKKVVLSSRRSFSDKDLPAKIK